MKNYYPVNMKILGAHFQIVSNECTNMHLFARVCLDKLVSTDGDGQTGRRTDRLKPI